MLSIAVGHDVGYLTGAVGGGRENYYTGAVAAGEPPGVWYGKGAELLGLSGEVDAEQMEAIYHHLLDPRDPASRSRATWGEAARLGKPHKSYRSADEIYAAALEREPHAGPERRAQLRADAERSARQPVSFYDVTFSAPKSASVLAVAFERAANEARAAGDEETAAAYETYVRAIEDAVMAGARAGLDYLEQRAGYARTGHHGGRAGRWVDAHNLVVAQFLQHDSREGDPQLHVHGGVLNRVLCADGVWRALDGQALHTWKAAASEISNRVTEAYVTRALGVRHETTPDGKSREIVGIDKPVRDLYSTRRRQTTGKAEQYFAAFRERFGREPSALERHRLSQRATLATRRAKSHNGETLGQRMDRWAAEAHQVMRGGLAEVARHVLDRAQRMEPAAVWSARDVIERAVAALNDKRATWSRSHLTRAVSEALPAHLDIDPQQVPELLDGLTDTALRQVVWLNPQDAADNPPQYLQRADGSPVYTNPSGARYAAPGQLAADHALRVAAVRRGAARLSADEAAAALSRFSKSGVELGADQAAAVRGVLTSGARVETLLAAAGTGKSFTIGAIADTWSGSGRRVFGLAPSQVATEVLADEGVTARNTARWLATQQRLEDAAPDGPDTGGRDPDGQWRLREGDLVVVDEAGMTDTAQLAEINCRCEQARAKLLLVGDPRQLAAVGPGGALADVAEHGISYQLAEVRRFSADWERRASLQLRDGDTTALDAYQRHGRLVDGGTAEQTETAAARAWLADTLAGREALLLVGSNEAAARASAALRADLIALGRVQEIGVELGRQGTVAGIGDLVQARRNAWELIGWENNTRAPSNRATYRVTGLRADGGLVVAPVHGRGDDGEQLGPPLVLPPTYVAEDLTLAYASTVHAAQGRTVDTAHAVIGPGTDAAGTYVAMTRGRERNTAYAVTTPLADDAATGQAHEVQQRTASAMLSEIIECDPHDVAAAERSALATAEHAEQESRSIQVPLDRLEAEIGELIAGRTGALLDRLAAEEILTDGQRVALVADEAYGSLERLLRTAEVAGHDPRRVLEDALADRSLDDARKPARVLHHRISERLRGQLAPQLSSYADLIPHTATGQHRQRLDVLAEAADARRRELGAETAQQAPQWAVEALGPVPGDAIARTDWEQRAGWAAAHRELSEHTDDADALGPAPPAGLAEKHAVWRAAHTALNLPDGGGDEDELSDGQLRVRVRAYQREEAWAPRYVGDELATTYQRAQRARADAQIWAARAEAAQDVTEAGHLRADARAAEAEAAELAQRAAALEIADNARGAWYAATAVTRDAADRARGALKARGVELDDPAEQVTAEQWLAAHRAEQLAEDPHREIHHEVELIDGQHDATLGAVAAPEPVVTDDGAATGWRPAAETAIMPDIRDTAEPDVTEHADPAQRHRVPTADETAAAVARAQAALAEIEARRAADTEREARDTERTERREELTRWVEQDRGADPAPARDDPGDDTYPVLQRSVDG
ncbi:MAG: relaxase domain-containing protein [Pseudonocardiaceae bacterium]|nr:relaxase domain-containing protein [Pseudonocardiaceae bacterium]